MRILYYKFIYLLLVGFLLVSCAKEIDSGEKTAVADGFSSSSSSSSSSSMPEVSQPGDSTLKAGVITVGEWNDFENWGFWQNLMNNDTLNSYQAKWGFFCKHKWEFTVKDINQQGLADVAIIIKNGGSIIWEGKTNKFGKLNVIPAILSASMPSGLSYIIQYKNIAYNTGSLSLTIPAVSATLPVTAANSNTVDVMFVVDATGSMGDEINYLKTELFDVLNRAEDQLSGTLRFASVFYRDFGDEYVTRTKSFSGSKSDLAAFVKAQEANGGGDWEEAVEEALKEAIKQDWSNSAKARILFLVLDAAPHQDTQKMQLLKEQVRLAASKGIILIPITASGIDKSTELLMRFMAQATNGTYTFITNHSGIGNNHITPTVGNYQVEYLNNFMVRMILKYGGN